MPLGLPFHLDQPSAALLFLTFLQLVGAPSELFNVLLALLWIMIALQRLNRSFSSLSRKDAPSQQTNSVYHTAQSEFDDGEPSADDHHKSRPVTTATLQVSLDGPYLDTVTRMLQDLSPQYILEYCGWRVTDRDYLRFAKARNGRLKDALKLIKEHVEFRRTYGPIENMRPHEDFPHALASKAWKFAGVTRCGHPFAVFKAKNIVPKDIHGGLTEYIKYLAYNLDSLGKTADSIPGSDGKLVVLIDLEGWSVSRNADMSFARQFIRLAQDEFPERLYAGILVNCPFVFTAFWRVMKPCLDSQTKEKIDILGADFHDTLVSRFLDKEQLEAEYGGTHRPYPDTVEHTMTFL
ncbi:hypothetical protein FOZ60_005298 [Perkinsus olseni]|uniref:CRAL-TRIO domain-containing protein n=2 Tax=Perkinsus olseni TaxID=32597 RepID=A0A7J6NRD0_PEROL|nr:hypothetical protein FOZ60_005298 [Perkinsus olseni]